MSRKPPNHWELWGIIPEGKAPRVVLRIPQQKEGRPARDLVLWRIPLSWEPGREFDVYAWRSGPSDFENMQEGRELWLEGDYDFLGDTLVRLARREITE